MVKELFDLPDSSRLDVTEESIQKDMEEKARNFDRLMSLLKEKTSDKATPTREKIQILTMAPPDWSRKEVAKFFEVSEYSVQEARKLAAEKGLLALPDTKRLKKLRTMLNFSMRTTNILD